jgi:hypothetical protein
MKLEVRREGLVGRNMKGGVSREEYEGRGLL